MNSTNSNLSETLLWPLIKWILIVVSFFLILFLYLKLAGPIPFNVSSISTQKTDLFSVTGEGKVDAKPDSAMVRAGIEAKGPSVEGVQSQINSVSNKVSQAVKNLGINESDIKTETYNVSPSYDYAAGSQKINGYQASTYLTIKVRNIDQVNAVIDAATKNGANVVSGADFEVSDKTPAEENARKEAVQDAKEKATKIAQIAGFKLGKIVNYQENTGQSVLPYARMDTMSAAGGGNKTEVEPGSSEVVISVTLSFEID